MATFKRERMIIMRPLSEKIARQIEKSYALIGDGYVEKSVFDMPMIEDYGDITMYNVCDRTARRIIRIVRRHNRAKRRR